MIKTLRPYQQSALDSVAHLLHAPTPPTIIEASVGAGKSLIIASLLIQAAQLGKRALCLTHSCDLIDQNYKTLVIQGGQASIFCAALNQKSLAGQIVFASPQSLSKNLGDELFDLIVIDECHLVNMQAKSGMFRKIINHYFHNSRVALKYCNVLGLTGTPFRGRNSIIGDFFKSTSFRITTNELIKMGFLVKPTFEIAPACDEIPFNKIKVQKNGLFNGTQLAEVASNSGTKTQKIMHLLGNRVIYEKRGGAFVFCATIFQCQIAKQVLDGYGEAQIITADTKNSDRMEWLEDAREGRCQFLISVNCLLVGVDVPKFDIACFIRPTESLTLFVQALGRVLRLSPGKLNAVVMDYAGNIERHQDVDDPLLNEALKPTLANNDYCIECYTCGSMNKITARRCIGAPGGKRCEYYFEFKDCPKCWIQNDITARHCRGCNFELLDHNRKLSLANDTITLPVDRVKYDVTASTFTIFYFRLENGMLYQQASETFYLTSAKALGFFYGKFIKPQVSGSSKWFPHLGSPDKLKEMVIEGCVKEPTHVVVNLANKVKKKIFPD